MIRKGLPLLMIFLMSSGFLAAQSFEAMFGTKRLFIDAQYLKFFDSKRKLSLFSRARATAEYDEQQTNLFTGAYLNYTTTSGVGATVLGRIGTFGSGIDAGLHYFKAGKQFMVYALPSINLANQLSYSWFSIMRYTPQLNKQWRLYSSLELFSAFNKAGHASSVQRIRLGLDKKGYQFGAAINLGQDGTGWVLTNTNPGVFIRKAF